jgi:alkylhydroperoxidase family enzyme
MTPETERVPRLSLDDAKAAAAAAGIPEYMADLSIFQVLLHHPELAARFNDLLGQMLWKNHFDARLRELVIMRVGWITGSVYEWAQHWRVGGMFGASEADLLATRDWAAYEGFGPLERVVLQATDEQVRDGEITASTWATLEGLVPDIDARIELSMAIGTWHMVSQVARSLAVPLEDGVEAWAPDGRAPETRAPREGT